uniref:PDZ domain-containing protein n=1 Tax=Fundidesulfovibrio putealis TaxID=270496 RepID=A0A7C4AFY5_9BACT
MTRMNNETDHSRSPDLHVAPARGGRAGQGRMMILAALWAALLFMPGCKRYSDIAEAPPAPAVQTLATGGFLDASGEPLDDAALAGMLSLAGYVLVGESHPSACDHEAQARVIELMASAGAAPAVGLEMVSVDRQPSLELFNKGILGVDQLEAELDWGRTWGYPFEVYRPIFEAARRHNLPLFALNAPRDIARKVGKTGLKGLTIQERLGLPSKIIPVSKEQEKALRQVFDAHPFGSVKDQEAAWKRFVTVQALWDTTMARRAVEARVETRRPVVIIAGSGHVERGWGIGLRLASFDPAAGRLLIMPWRGGDKPDPADAQVFFHCPEVKRPRLGLTLETVEQGIRVVAVADGSRAEAAGIRPGDVLVRAQGSEVRELKDLHAATLKAQGEDGLLRLDILRGGEPATITITLPVPGQGS